MADATVSVVLPRTLMGLTDDVRRHEVPLAGVDTVGTALDALGAAYPVFARRIRDETGALRRYVNVYLDGDDVRGLAGPDTPVHGGEEIMIIASVAGG